MAGPVWMPMPMRSGSGRSWISARLPLGKPSKLDQHGLSDAALSVLVPVNKFLSTRHLNPLCNGFLMQPMGAAHLIQHPLCNLFGRHSSFAARPCAHSKLSRQDDTTGSCRPEADC